MPRSTASRGPDDGAIGIHRFTNKTVSFRFVGRELSFLLSHALFSSNDIDDGTRLLLKSVAQRVDAGAIRSVLDVGCGVGIIGECVAAWQPRAAVRLQDRDALAVALSLENGRQNGLENVTATASLAFSGLGGESFDLITSNLPAKAGKPVLQSFLRHAASRLSPDGTAAIVIVSPLAGLVQETLGMLRCEVIHSESTPGYTVTHFRAGRPFAQAGSGADDLAPYVRARSGFSFGDVSYGMETVHSLPDFDALGYSLELSFALLSDVKVAGDALFWNPGQGHLPMHLLAKPTTAIRALSIASRDCLELAIAERNIASAGRRIAASLPLASEEDLKRSFPAGSQDFLFMCPHPIPRVPWQAEAVEAAAALLRPGGMLFIVSTSTEVQRLPARHPGFRSVAVKKREGLRCILMQRL